MKFMRIENVRFITVPGIVLLVGLMIQVMGIGKDIRSSVLSIHEEVKAIDAKVATMDEKLFKHLTNDELHVPRSLIATRAEFDMHCAFSQKLNDDVMAAIRDLRNDINYNMKSKVR